MLILLIWSNIDTAENVDIAHMIKYIGIAANVDTDTDMIKYIDIADIANCKINAN